MNSVTISAISRAEMGLKDSGPGRLRKVTPEMGRSFRCELEFGRHNHRRHRDIDGERSFWHPQLTSGLDEFLAPFCTNSLRQKGKALLNKRFRNQIYIFSSKTE